MEVEVEVIGFKPMKTIYLPSIYLITLLAFCIFLPACTLHKKLNEKGYGVFWKKRNLARTTDEFVQPSISSAKTTSTISIASVNESFVLQNEIHAGGNSRLDSFTTYTDPFNSAQKNSTIKDSYSKFSQKKQGVLLKKEANTNDQKQNSTRDPDQRVEKMAKTALLLGLISSPLSYLVGLGILPALVSIVLAAISLRKIKKNPSIYAENAKLNAKIALLTSLASICMIGSAVFLGVGLDSNTISCFVGVILSGFSIFAALRSVSSKQEKADYPTFRIIASILTAGLSSLIFILSFLLMLHTA